MIVGLLLVLLSTLWSLATVLAVQRVRRRRTPCLSTQSLPSVSLLKPLRGADAELEASLETFFRQDYPADRFELVFGVEGDEDPALAVVRALRDRHPEVACRLVRHDGGRGLNPKVGNLRAMMGAARHGTIVISDSNVSVAPGYLRHLASELDQPGVGLVTSLFAGVGEGRLGSTVEDLHLAGENAGAVALATELAGHPVAVGKSMIFRRDLFECLGGFESVANVLAEDYVMGRMFHEAGYGVRLARDPVRNVTSGTTLRAFFGRQLRWGVIRLRMQPLAFVAEPLSRPLVVALLVPLLGVPALPALAWACALTVLRDAVQWTALRGSGGLLRALPVFPLRDLLATAAWLAAFFRRHVRWRGHRVRISAGTRLYADRALPVGERLSVEG